MKKIDAYLRKEILRIVKLHSAYDVDFDGTVDNRFVHTLYIDGAEYREYETLQELHDVLAGGGVICR